MLGVRTLAVRLLVGLALFALAVSCLVHWSRHREERRLHSAFSAYLSPEAAGSYGEQPLAKRLKISRDTQAVVAQLEEVPWQIRLDSLQERPDSYPYFVYSVDMGSGSVSGCRFGMDSLPTLGQCAEGRYVDLRQGSEPLQVEESFRVTLGSDPHAETRERTVLSVGRSGAILVEGHLRIEDRAATIRDGEVLVPEPLAPDRMQRVSVGDFEPTSEQTLVTKKNWDFHLVIDMPSQFASLFDDAPRLTIARLESALEVDLDEVRPGFVAAGRLTVLNHEFGEAEVEYFPGHYASLRAGHLTFPAPLPGLCFNLRDVLAEIDLVEKRFRVGGTMVIDSAESFSCSLLGTEMGFMTRQAVAGVIDTTWNYLGLPETILSRGHFVVDWDDLLLCGDASINGTSLVNAALDLRARDLYVWAPKHFETTDLNLDSSIASAVQVGQGLLEAEWSFPRSSDWTCWEDDRGPQTDLFAHLLPAGDFTPH